MNNYLQLLGENINDVIFDKVLDIYEYLNLFQDDIYLFY